MLLPYYCRLTLSSIVWVLNFQRDIFHLLNMIQHVTEMSLVHETLNRVDVVIWNCRHSIVLMYFWVNDINIFSLGDLWNTFNKTLFDRFNVLLNLNNLPEKKFLEVGFVYLRIFYFRYLILYHIADLQCNLTIQDVSDKNKLLGHKHSNIFDHVFSNRVSM